MSGDVMTEFVSSLTTGLSSDALWGALAPAGTLIVVVTLFALGKYILGKNIRAAGKGKSGRV